MQVLCGHCGSIQEAPDSAAGAKVVCTGCGRQIKVPHFGDDAARALPGRKKKGMEVTHEDMGEVDPHAGFADVARHSMRRKIRLTCGGCNMVLSVPVRFSGKKIRCPACKAGVRIPYPEESAPEVELPDLADDEQESEQFEFVGEDDQNGTQGKAPESKAMRDLAAAVSTAHEPTQSTPINAHPRFWGDLLGSWAGGPSSQETLDEGGQGAVQWAARRKVLKLALITAVVMAVVAVGIIVPRYFVGPHRQESPRPAESPQAFVAPRASPTPRLPSPTKSPTAQPTPMVGPVAPVTPPSLDVTDARLELFAADGYLPAAPGRLYAKVSVTLTAGSKELAVPAYGQGVCLVVSGERLESLGTAPRKQGVLPTRAQRMTISLKPGKHAEATLVFDVPQNARSATLDFSPLPPVEVIFAEPARSGTELGGVYVEQPPRNLKPELGDPVMSAIQQAVGQRLEVIQSGGELAVSIPSAGVVGLARQAGDGLFDVRLWHGKDRLDTKLRLADEGKTVLLYLSDKPFHQITYRRM